MRRALILLLVTPPLVWAAPFADPMRPPQADDGQVASGAPEGPRLESVLIAPDRRIAVISGQQVVVGAKIAGGEVVRISEGEVVIRSGERLQTLRLVPDMRQPAGAPKKGAKQ